MIYIHTYILFERLVAVPSLIYFGYISRRHTTMTRARNLSCFSCTSDVGCNATLIKHKTRPWWLVYYTSFTPHMGRAQSSSLCWIVDANRNHEMYEPRSQSDLYPEPNIRYNNYESTDRRSISWKFEQFGGFSSIGNEKCADLKAKGHVIELFMHWVVWMLVNIAQYIICFVVLCFFRYIAKDWRWQ